MGFRRQIMRILQLHTQYRLSGGEDSVVQDELELLRLQGHEVVQHLSVNPRSGVAAASHMAMAISNPLAASTVRSVVRSTQPDVVHVHNTWFSMSPSVLSAAHATAPVVMTIHNYRLLCANGLLFRSGELCELCVDGSLWNGVIHNCYRDPVSSAIAAATIFRNRPRWRNDVDLFLVLSSFAARLLIASGIPANKVKVKDNFVGDPGPREIDPAASDRILFVGRLSEEKGIRKLVDSRGVFRAEGLRLEIVGDGPLRTLVEEAMRDQYLGQRAPAEVVELMMSSRALILPSMVYEGQPRTAIESFAAGLPVLGASQGAIGELLNAQGANWTFDPRSSWSDAVRSLADDRLVQAGSVSARALYEERFTPKQCLRKLESAYQTAIDRHQRDCSSSAK
jgi:glycosyltransferase involved in cell wall biosynthesis